MNRSNMIYIWRILFTYLIAWFHLDNIYRISSAFEIQSGLYIAVEFFFIVSGFLLYRYAVPQKEKYPSTMRYILNRYDQIFPVYIICLAITFVFWSNGGIRDRIHGLVDSFWELLCLQCVGLNRGWTDINPTAWYISALLILSFFLFFLLRHCERITLDFVIPLSIMVFYSWFYRYRGNLDIVVDMEGFYLNGPLMRGFAGLGLGVVAARLNQYLEEHAKRLFLWKCAGSVGFLGVIAYAATHGATNKDFILAIVITVCVAIAFLPNEKWEIPKWVKKWSQACLGIYLIHEVFRTYLFPYYLGVPEAISQRVLIFALYTLAISVAGGLVTIAGNWLRKGIGKVGSFLLQ